MFGISFHIDTSRFKKPGLKNEFCFFGTPYCKSKKKVGIELLGPRRKLTAAITRWSIVSSLFSIFFTKLFNVISRLREKREEKARDGNE